MSTTTKHYHFDALGSTLALTDSGENVTDTYKYYAFGGSLSSSGATVNNLRFVGNLGYYLMPPAPTAPLYYQVSRPLSSYLSVATPRRYPTAYDEV